MNATQTHDANEIEQAFNQFNAEKHRPHKGGEFGMVRTSKARDEVVVKAIVVDAEDVPMGFVELVNRFDGEVFSTEEDAVGTGDDSHDKIRVRFEV